MLSETEQFDRADRLFQRALSTPAVPTSVLLNYATFLSHSGRLADAKPHYSNAAARAVGDLQALITASGSSGAAAVAVQQLAIAECNLARTHLALGEVAVAKALAEKWLVMESTWGTAAEIVWDCVEHEGLDMDAEAARYHAACRASPAMVAELAHAAHERAETGAPFEALHIAAAGCAYLHFDWTKDLEGLAEELEQTAKEADVAVRTGQASAAVRRDLKVLASLLGRDWGEIDAATLAMNAALSVSMVVHAVTGEPIVGDERSACCGVRGPAGVVAAERGSISCEACLTAIEDALAWRQRVDAGEEPRQPDDPRNYSDSVLDKYYESHTQHQSRESIVAYWANRW
jgi:tetratricopeptide (TPR) repeat protein